MMRLLSRTLITFACVGAAGAAMAGDDHKGLDQVYARLTRALKAMDVKATHVLLAPRFTWVDPQGHVMNRAEFIAMDNARNKMPGLKFHEVSMKNDSYDFMGDEARVRSTTTVVLSMMENGKRVKYRGISESVDTWRRGPRGQWMAYKVEVTSETFGPAN